MSTRQQRCPHRLSFEGIDGTSASQLPGSQCICSTPLSHGGGAQPRAWDPAWCSSSRPPCLSAGREQIVLAVTGKDGRWPEQHAAGSASSFTQPFTCCDPRQGTKVFFSVDHGQQGLGEIHEVHLSLASGDLGEALRCGLSGSKDCSNLPHTFAPESLY